MPSGFIQLLSVGSEYEYLNKDPHISFFNAIYRRYSNFYMTTVQLYNKEFNNTKDINNLNNYQTFLIPPSGDLLTNSLVKLSYNNKNYLEILKTYVDQIDTKTYDILSFYDNYYILKYKYSKAQINNFEIIKINYVYDNNDNYYNYLTIWTANTLKNKETILNLIKFNNKIDIQTDSTKNYYNIYLEYLYYSFIYYINTDNLSNNQLLFNIIDCINYDIIDYIRLDLNEITSYKLYTQNKLIYKDFYNLVSATNYSNNIKTDIKIFESNIYYKIKAEDISIYENFINNSIKEVSKFLDIEIITDKKTSKNMVISYDEYIKSFKTSKINTNNIIYLPIIPSNTRFVSTYYPKNIYFGNTDNYDYNESLILIEKNHIKVSNYNLINNLSLITYIRTFLKIGCITEIDILRFLTNVKDTNFLYNLENFYSKNNNNILFFKNILDILVNKDVLIFSNSSFRTLIFLYENYVYQTNKINSFFYSKKISNIQNIIVLKNLYTNILTSINSLYLSTEGLLNFSVNSSVFLNFFNQTKNEFITFNELYSIIVNYDYNNYYFNNKTTITFNNPNNNILLKENIFLYNFFVIILINLILGSIEPISSIYYNSSKIINSELLIDTEKFNIYNNLGKYKNILNSYTYSLNIFPLTSYLFLNKITDSISTIYTFSNISLEQYYDKIYTSILRLFNIYDELYDTNIYNKLNNYTIDDIKKIINLFSFKFIDVVDNYYKDNDYYLRSIALKDINSLFTYFFNNPVISYDNNTADDSNILLNIFQKADNQLFGSSFITFINNKTPNLANNNLYIYKFLFIVNSPFYRIYLLIRFLYTFSDSELSTDFIVLRNYLTFYLIVYIKDDVEAIKSINILYKNFDISKKNFDNLELIDNFISYDEINTISNDETSNKINNTNNENLLIYTNFYFIKSFIKVSSNIDNIYPSIYNTLKYNYDDLIFNNLITQVQSNNELFFDINYINNFLNVFFDKNNYNINKVFSLVLDIDIVNVEKEILNNKIGKDCYYSSYSLGTYFDNTNKLNIDTINNIYNLYLDFNLVSNFNDLYLIKTFDIKRYQDFIKKDNIIDGFNYYNTLYNNINNVATIKNIYNYYNEINNSLLKYILDNFSYLNNYYIPVELFNLYLGYFKDVSDLFNSTNDTNINLYNYLPNTLNTYKRLIINNKIIIVYFLYKSLIEQCLFLDIKYYVQKVNSTLNYNLKFKNFIIDKYGFYIYTDILNKLVINITKNITNLYLDYSRVEIFYISNDISPNLTNFITLSKDFYLSNYVNEPKEYYIQDTDDSIYITSTERVYFKNQFNNFFINLFQSNFNIQVYTIGFYQNLNNLLSSLTNELIIYLFFVLNNNLINLIIETDINKNLNEINQLNKNDFYNASIIFIKNAYYDIQNLYDKNFYNLVNKTTIINKILKLVENFYGKNDINYYNVLYFKYNKTFDNIVYDIRIDINNLINNKISYSTVCEKEINRFLYYYMTMYATKLLKNINTVSTLESINFIKNNSTYQYVKMYDILYKNSVDIVYEENLEIYQNEQVLSLLNIDFFTDKLSTINNAHFIDFISSMATNYYTDYLYFYNYMSDNLGTSFNNILINNLNAFDYFTDLNNIDELNDYVNKFLTLEEYFSPYYIYDNIVKYRFDSLNIDTKLELISDKTVKKIVIYLFMLYLILQKLPIYINENLNLKINYILEYNIISDKISFLISDVLNTQIIDDLKKLIYDMYSLDPKYDYYTNDYTYNDVFIINVINNNLKQVRVNSYLEFARNYVNSYIENIISINNKSSFFNLIKEINDIFDYDALFNNNQLLIYSGFIDRYYYEYNLYDFNSYTAESLNKNISNSLFFENLIYYYDRTDLYNINILLIRFILYLEEFGIVISSEQRKNIDGIISYTRLNAVNINPTLENIKGYNSYNDYLYMYQENNNYTNVNNYLMRNDMSWNYILNLMVNSNDNNFSLITPIDYDYDTAFVNFGNIYNKDINLYKKFYNYNYNFYLYPNNYVGIYQQKEDFYNKILKNQKNLFNIKRTNYNFYKLLFNNIILTKYSNVYLTYDTTFPDSYFIPVFSEIINLYLSYKNIYVYENDQYLNTYSLYNYFKTKIILNNQASNLEGLISIVNEMYFYQLFKILFKDYNKNTVQIEYIDFINQISSVYNNNFVYINGYNLLTKLIIQFTLVINYLNKTENYGIIFDDNVDNINTIFNNVNKYLVSKENINNYIYFEKLGFLLNIVEYDELLILLANSIQILIQYDDNNYEYYLNLVYVNNFQKKSFTTYNGDIKILSFYEVSYTISNYLVYIIQKNDIFINEILYKSLVEYFNDNMYKNYALEIISLLFKLNNYNYYGLVILTYNKTINNELLELNLTFLNLYFIKMSDKIINNTTFNQINNNLLILYNIFIFLQMTYFIKEEIYFDLLISVITSSYTIIYENKLIPVINMVNDIIISVEYSNYVKQYNILNYNKDILNSSIYLTRDYDINNFNNIVDDYNYNNIFNIIYLNNLYQTAPNINVSFFGNLILNLLNKDNLLTYYTELELAEQTLIKNTINIIINMINVYLEKFKELYGGYYNNIDSNLSINLFTDFFNENDNYDKNTNINIFTLIYTNFSDDLNKINFQMLVVLFYNIFMLIYLYNYGNTIINDIEKIVLYLCNLIYKKILIYYDNKINTTEYIETLSFFRRLNVLIENNYSNTELIALCYSFFNTIISNNLSKTDDTVITNINNFINKTYNGLDEYSVNNLFIIDNFYRKNFKNNKIIIFKYLLNKVFDVNQSILILYLKSIIPDDLVNIQQDYIGKLRKNTLGFVNNDGILKIIDKIELYFNDELIDTLSKDMLLLYYSFIENINKIRTLNEFYGKDQDYVLYGLRNYIINYSKDFYIPIYFFYKEISKSLSLISSMYVNKYIKVKINSENIIKSYYGASVIEKGLELSLLVDFIYVEKDERKSLTEKRIDNLINTHYNFLDSKKYEPNNNTFNINEIFNINDTIIYLNFEFNEMTNLCYQLYWELNLYINNIQVNNIINVNELILSTVIYFDDARRDGIKIIDKRNFNKITTTLNKYKYCTRANDNDINTYSFSYEPNNIQPSGAVNLYKLDKFTIEIAINNKLFVEAISRISNFWRIESIDWNINLQSLNYNILRYQSGLSGLLYKRFIKSY
jgi:hypothetical protein